MKKIKTERGQSLVEMAISLVLLLLLLVGAVEFGMAFFQFVQLRDAAQEGALYGSMNPYIDANNDGKFNNGEAVNQAGIETRVRAASNSPIDLANTTSPKLTIVASSSDGTNMFCEDATGAAQHGVTVTVTFKHKIFMPFIPQILNLPNNEIPLKASVTDTILSPTC